MDLLERLKKLVESIVEAETMELVDLEFKKSKNKFYLKIFIDKDGGVTLDDCQKISRLAGKRLDENNLIEHSYILEVSSPGLDRPLKEKRDFMRHKDKLVRLYTSISLGKKKEFTARIIEAGDDCLLVARNKGDYLELPYSAIKKARLEI